MSDFATWTRDVQARTEAALARRLPAPEVEPRQLHEAMRYVLLGSGKRVRPMLTFAAAETVGASPEVAEPAACAVEMIHTFSLTHDDLPCMDDDALRRGRPTCHVRYGEAVALLAGDALQSAAFEALADDGWAVPAEQRLEMLRLLARATGSRGMCGGQAVDLASTGKTLDLAELEFMHRHKTGALIHASVLLGALAAGPLDGEARAAMDHYAKCVGLTFQVMDDVLDAEADTATLGKTAGKDAAQGKATYLTLMTPAEARAYAGELVEDALGAVAGFGDAGRRLAEIARFMVERRF